MATRKEKAKQKKSKTSRTRKAAPKSERAPKAAASRKVGKPTHIVGMGASAGGLEAFKQFFSKMPSDSGLAFILVSHLDPTHISMLPELIQRSTDMEVIEVGGGTVVKANTVYIIPPNSDMAIWNGTLQLMEPSQIPGPRMSIDYFLRSLAQDQRERAVCIILSGMGTDGSLGLKAIKEELGMAMIQDLDGAKYTGMPRSAMETGLADYVLPPAEMPEQLIKYTRHLEDKPILKITSAERAIPDALQQIFVLLRSSTGHDFSHYKQNTICRRIERRMKIHQMENVSEYVRYLGRTPHEVHNLFRELLIGVTNFFRDAEAFEIIKKKALPRMLANKPEDESVRAWVPGCSTGEEAYSIAIVLRECMDDLKRYGRSGDIQIFATDIDEDAIEKARTAAYPGSIAVDVSQARLNRFFMKEDNFYRINKDIRDMLIFAPQNIIADPPFTKIDLICCRNLLIYLDTELQKKLVTLFHYSLRPEGILFLGSSETIGGFTDLFASVDRKWKVFRRKETAIAVQPMAGFPRVPPPIERTGVQVKRTKEFSVPQLAQKSLLERYAPPCAIVNDAGDILYIHGRTGKYLEPASGEARWSIFDMAREGLRVELPSAIRKAASGNKEVTYEGLQVKTNGEVQPINLTVRPVDESEGMRGLFLVLFEDLTPPPKTSSRKKTVATGKQPDKRVAELERELKHIRESHQITVEELETSNEELKATNEELQSTIEELQSANEEMETSKEELQSLNEELVTVNTELQEKNEELARANNDMKNLFDSIEVPTVFLDGDLRIKRFTAYATKVIHLIHSDVGRPITDIATTLEHEDLAKVAGEVLRTLAFREVQVKTKKGHWYLMRVLPYRTVDDVIDGVVIAFLDIHEQKRAQLAQQEAREFLENVVDTVREPLVVLDDELRVELANSTFYQPFGMRPEEIEGQFIYDLGNRQWNIPRLRQLLEEVIPQESNIEDFEVEHTFEKIGKRRMFLHAREIRHLGVGTRRILLTIEDVTDKSPVKEMQKKARTGEQEDSKGKTNKGSMP
jgi:two-component system CheB/CheR fusion protein